MKSGPPDQGLPPVLKAVIDTNILIHGRNLADLPWEELSDTAVEIVLVRQVIGEIDNLKNRPGRVGKLGRSANTLIRELMELPAFTKTLRHARPVVRLRIELGAKSPQAHEGLDPNKGDHAILLQALSLQEAGARVVLVTNDNVAALTAMEHGISCHLTKNAWLRPSEPDETERQLEKIKAELGRYKAAEPIPEIWFEDGAGRRLDRLEVQMPTYLPIEQAIVDALVKRVMSAEARKELEPSIIPESPPQEPGFFDITKIAVLRDETGEPIRPITADMIEDYYEAYDAWLTEVRRQINDLHSAWNLRRSWPSFVITARNIGTRPAKDMLIEVESRGNISVTDKDMSMKSSNSSFRLLLPTAPTPPKTESYRSELLASMLNYRDPVIPILPPLGQIQKRRDPEIFYWRTKNNTASALIALECEIWRHQREAEIFPLELGSLSEEDSKGAIVARISAGNLSNPVECTLPIKITFRRADLSKAAEKMVDLFEAGRRSAASE